MTIAQELRRLYEADQFDRMEANNGLMEWSEVEDYDELRRARVIKIVEASDGLTSDDWFHAAMIMHHGKQPDVLRAHYWALRAATMTPAHSLARWLAAAAEDRCLMLQGKPQRYGTQIRSVGGRWQVYDVDPRVTDEERAQWGVPSIAEAQRKCDEMNALEERSP